MEEENKSRIKTDRQIGRKEGRKAGREDGNEGGEQRIPNQPKGTYFTSLLCFSE